MRLSVLAASSKVTRPWLGAELSVEHLHVVDEPGLEDLARLKSRSLMGAKM
jgi:hypothetical protein